MATRISGRSLTGDASAINGSIPGVHVTTDEEGRALFDRQAQKALSISGNEFLRRWDGGEYRHVRDNAEGRKVRRLAMLIPFARRSKA
jgi:hypothetical protein